MIWQASGLKSDWDGMPFQSWSWPGWLSIWNIKAIHHRPLKTDAADQGCAPNSSFVELIRKIRTSLMLSLNKLIIAIFGRGIADNYGGAFMFIIYGLLFLILLAAIIVIEKKFFPESGKKKPWIRFVAIILGVMVIGYVIPWLLCEIFLKEQYI
jgi:hypothetical protein